MTKRTLLSTVTALGSVLIGLSAPACGGDDTAVPPDAATDGTSSDGAAPGDGSTEGGGSDAASDAGPPTAAFVAHFNAATGELPEGLTIRGGKAYLGFAPTGKIVSVDVATGAVTPYASLPTTAANFTLGMVFDAAGNLYVGVGAAAAGGAATAGVYKVPPSGDAGGAPVRQWAGAAMLFPNGLSLDTAGTRLYVADSNDGAVYRFALTDPVTTTATPWKKDPLLAGDAVDAGVGTCPKPNAGFPLGANGIIVDASGAYVANTDKGLLVRVPIDGSGNPGTATAVVNDCAKLEGIDGIAFDSKDQSIVALVNSANTLVRIVGAGSVPLLSGAPFDSPASIVQVPGQSGPEQFLVTNAAFASAQTDGGSPQPGLLKVSVP